MSERRFPVLNSMSDRRAAGDVVVRSVPWSLVEPLREKCRDVHDQTLERLAERGGLGAEEIWAHVHWDGARRRDWFALGKEKTQAELHAWLRDLGGEP